MEFLQKLLVGVFVWAGWTNMMVAERKHNRDEGGLPELFQGAAFIILAVYFGLTFLKNKP